MAKVVGIGGVFFKCRDPEGLAAWYSQHLGFDAEGGAASFVFADAPAGAYSVWGPFDDATRYFDPSVKPFMINLMVDDLDGMLEKLRASGVETDDRVEDHTYGRFSWFMDPEGNRVELWEPNGVTPPEND